MALIGDFLRALGQMTDARFLGVLAVSVALTVALLAGLAGLAGVLLGFLPQTVDLPLLGEVSTPLSGLQALGVLAVLGASVFLMIPVAVIFVNLFLDRIMAAVERRHYPEIGPVREQGVLEALGSGLSFAMVVVAANLVGLIFYVLSGPLAPFVFIAVNGYLLGREYFQTVSERYMTRAEAAVLRQKTGWTVWLAGTLLAIPLVIPVLNLVIPVLGVATFTHFVNRARGVLPVSRRAGMAGSPSSDPRA